MRRCTPPHHLSYLEQGAAQLAPPVTRVRMLRDENEVCPSNDSAMQRQPAATATHDLHNKVTLVRGSGGGESIDRRGDTMQSRVTANGQVGAGEVIVNAAHQPHNPVRI